MQGIPRLTRDKNIQRLIENEIKEVFSLSSYRRDVFIEIITDLVKFYSNSNFILRPHPRSTLDWWQNKLNRFDNLNIVSLKSIEPWIHASEFMICMGCTTGIQSIVARKNIYEIHDNKYGQFGLCSSLVKSSFADSSSLISQINNVNKSNVSFNYDHYDFHKLNKTWVNTDKCCSGIYAQLINKYSSDLHANFSSLDSLESKRINKFDGKWSYIPTHEEVMEKLEKICSIYRLSTLHLDQISEGVWHIYK